MKDVQPFKLLLQVVERGYIAFQVFENNKEIEVEVRFGKLNRNTNPSALFVIENDKLYAQLGFWSASKTGELEVIDLAREEVVEGYGYTISQLEDMDQHFEKIIAICTDMLK